MRVVYAGLMTRNKLVDLCKPRKGPGLPLKDGQTDVFVLV